MVRSLLTILFALTVYQPVSEAQGAPDLAGLWEGTIDIPGSPLGVNVELKQNESWSGTIDIPAQDAAGVPLRDVQVRGKTVNFAIADIPGEPTFDGTVSDDSIEGTFSQSGQSFPFTLGRKVALSGAERTVALGQGRTLTELFYNRKFAEVYAKFSDKMQTSASTGQAELDNFWQEIESQVGNETGIQSETVDETGGFLTYTRTATFSKIDLPIEVQWIFGAQGLVEGFSARPAQNATQGGAEAPSKQLEYQTKTALQLPFDGSWSVFWGGRTIAENYHAAYPDNALLPTL